MPLDLSDVAPTILIRRSAFERAGLTRAALDARWNLTDDEFRVEGDLVAVGPLVGSTSASEVIEAMEDAGLTYFDDFFELPGRWPPWLRLVALAPRR